jgi:hypothetical protein
MRIGAGSVRDTAKVESAYVVAVTFRDGKDAAYTVTAGSRREAIQLAHAAANDEQRGAYWWASVLRIGGAH